jgi:hypothetical protein
MYFYTRVSVCGLVGISWWVIIITILGVMAKYQLSW